MSLADQAEPAQPAPGLGLASQAVYRCYSGSGQLLYIGTTGALGRRLADHAQKIWFLEVCGITLEWYEDEEDALEAERRAIHVERPKYNVTHNTGKPLAVQMRRHVKAAAKHPDHDVSQIVTQVVAQLGQAPPAEAPISIDQRRLTFARTIRQASPEGITPSRLKKESGLSNTKVHQLLALLVKRGLVTRVASGVYRPTSERLIELSDLHE